MKRKDNESFEDYRERRKKTNKLVKSYCRGFLVWNSSKEGAADSRALWLREIEVEKQTKKLFEGVAL